MTKAESRAAQREKPLGDEGLEAIRKIVREKQFGKVNEVAIDTFSASAVVAVADILDEKALAKLKSLPVTRVVSVCLKMCKGS